MFKHLIENNIGITPSPDTVALSELGLLTENKLDTDRHVVGQPNDDSKVTTKHTVEGRNVDPHKGSGLLAVNRELETKRVGLM